MMKGFGFWAFVFVIFGIASAPVFSQAPTQTDAAQLAKPIPTPSPSLERHFLKNIAHDQLTIWTAPFKPHNYDAKWFAPLALGTATLISTDRYTSRWVSNRGGLPVVSHDVSWAGKAYVTGGVAAAFYFAGRATHNAKARETGILAAEALIDTGIVTEVLKLATNRQRPNTDRGDAEFWGGGSSFPSGHASTIWSVATVISYEYKDNPWVRYGALAAAVAVSASRYSGRNHFLSDIVVGSALGFTIGRFVYKEHHMASSTTTGLPKTTTKLIPAIVPFYDARTRTFGGSAVWHL